ncbi:MAG: site-specific DNA-methyltransferase [Bacteroidales bacterium]|jgi:DNA modification methylase|nr:site-specific DNA-methyltransferase [Bacteroidales bacterium]
MSKRLIEYKNKLSAEDFFKKYSANGKPIPISFRTLFPELRKSDRYTHLIHSYPAKLLCHIPYFFLNNTYFSQKGETILDPFCGTGTVLLEANLAGRCAVGADANPLARKIATVKTRKIDTVRLEKKLITLIHKAQNLSTIEYPDIRNRDFWFPIKTQTQLSKICQAINELPADEYKDFFEICFSNCVKKVSYADPRIAVPVKINPERFDKKSERHKKVAKRLSELESIDVFEKFKTIATDNTQRIKNLPNDINNVSSKIISENARLLTSSIGSKELLSDGCIDMILTSPPYAGAQKYIRSSSLNLGWLGLTANETLNDLDKKNIGRENYLTSEIKEIKTGIKSADELLSVLFVKNKLRAYIVGNYLIEMKDAIDESIRVLKKDGYFVVVIGNNKVCDMEFNTQEYLSEYIQSKGLELKFKLIDDIKSYGLMTKRNKTADIISREWILVFRK